MAEIDSEPDALIEHSKYLSSGIGVEEALVQRQTAEM